MEKDNKFTLSFENVKNIPFDKYEKNFTFIVNGKEYVTSRAKADFLSPLVSRYHDTDESIQEITINTKEEEEETRTEFFSDFINLTTFTSNEIDEKHRKHYIEYFYLLGNTNEYLRLQPEYYESLSSENIVDRLKFLQQMNRMDGINESKVINYASEHFEEIDKEELKTLELSILEEIIKNSSLQLEEDDSLIEFILNLYKEDDKYSILFEYVEFENVKKENLQKFIDEFDIEFLNSKIWHKICQRLITSEPVNEPSPRYKIKYLIKEHKKGDELNGLLRYLSDKTGGNIHDNGTIEVTSNSIHNSLNPKYLLDYQNTEACFYHSLSNSEGYICFDFKDRKIQLSSYTIKSYPAGQNYYHLKNWNIEVSNDKKHWIPIDKHKNDSTLNGSKIISTFNIQQKQTDFFQYVRLHQTGTNWQNDYFMLFYSLEMYGILLEPSNKTK